MVKEEQAKLRKEQNNVIKKINDKWLELQEDFYICYSVKELAYKVAYDILNEYFGDYSGYMQIYYRFYKDKHKIIFYIKDNIYMAFDIYWVSGMFGDSGLKIGNGHITNKIKSVYRDIEDVLENEDNEE